jgi:hypothetical protein
VRRKGKRILPLRIKGILKELKWYSRGIRKRFEGSSIRGIEGGKGKGIYPFMIL